ncbi:MAG: selenoneine biosynthesis selenosugar synthase SenB [Candidatus Binatia bacterium]
MRVLIACPAPARSRHGNRVTALRWARILREIGCRVRLVERYEGGDYDLLIALHARRSSAAVERFRARNRRRPIVVALTGTDLYRDLARNRSARRALETATRLVVLQPLGIRSLPRRLRRKARVVYQSAEKPKRRPRRCRDIFEVAVIGHLRAVKDPLRAALAARRLPPRSRVRVVHLGKAMTAALATRARAETARNRRYRWLGERSRKETRAVLSRSQLMVLSSRLEGGANVISEAITASVPVLASRIPGSIGLLGARYPGFFDPGDTHALAKLLERAETDWRFYRRLKRAAAARAPLFDPAEETRSWRRLLDELTIARGIGRSRAGALLENPTSSRRRRAPAGAPSRARR